ncbi:MAG: hypothetical protein ACMXYL_01750 [Candidatus Woesearchaeota archaeon]
MEVLDLKGAYRVMTSADLSTQSVFHGDERLYYTEGVLSSIDADTSMFLMEHKVPRPIIVGYHNTVAMLPKNNDKFPVTGIMHYFLAKTLAEQELQLDNNTIADLDCGSGFLGNYLGLNISGMDNGLLVFSDSYPESLDAAFLSYLINNNYELSELTLDKQIDRVLVSHDNGKRALFLRGHHMLSLEDIAADIAVCAPDYIPYLWDDHPESYYVLGQVSKNMGSELYVAHSSLSNDAVLDAVSRMNSSISTIGELETPLLLQVSGSRKLPTLNSPEGREIVESLIDKGMRIITKNSYKIPYHTIMVSKITHQ